MLSEQGNRPPLKLLFIIRHLGIGGAERQLVALANGLADKGHTITILTFYPRGALEKDVRQDIVRIQCLSKKNRWDIFGFIFRFAISVRDCRPDFVYSFMDIPNILIALFKPFTGNPGIAWGIRSSNMKTVNYDWLWTIGQKLEKWLSFVPDVIICNSNAGRMFCEDRGMPVATIRVVENGIDINRFYSDKEAGRKFRKTLGLPDRGILIGITGRLDPMKDYVTFLKAAALFKDNNRNARFVIIGDGPYTYREFLVSLAGSLGVSSFIQWVDAVEDMHAAYNALDLFTLSSVYGEGFSNVIAEAMACGIPCVATDVGDAAAIIGDTGIVVEPEEPEQLAGAWERILSGSGSSYSENGGVARDRIVRNYALDTMIRKTETILYSLTFS